MISAVGVLASLVDRDAVREPPCCFAAALTTFFPKMVTAFSPGYVFLFFCGMMVLQLIWIRLMVPETKGVPLEEIQKRMGIES